MIFQRSCLGSWLPNFFQRTNKTVSRPTKNFARCNELSQPPLRQNGLVMSIMQSTEKVAPKNNERLVLNIKVLTAPMVIIFQSLTKLKPLEESDLLCGLRTKSIPSGYKVVLFKFLPESMTKRKKIHTKIGVK